MGIGDIKLEMLITINMELKERTEEKVRAMRATDSTGMLERRVGNTFFRRFKDGNLCVTRASVLLGIMNLRDKHDFSFAFFFEHC